jgi:site-specific DNA-methyltransferase (adenine-specific)
MGRMDDGFVDLTVTSPPYDNLRDYNGFEFNFQAISKELYRVTKDGGVVVWIVADATINGSETGTSFRQALGFMDVGFRLHDTMIWNKANPIPTDPRIGRYTNSLEYMFVFSKGKPVGHNLIRIPCINAGAIRRSFGVCSQLKKDGSQRTDRVLKRLGKATRSTKVKSNVWVHSIPNGSYGHPAQFPESLARDHIISWSNPGDLVYDPFMGSGTTAKMAYQLDRKFIGSEISSEYVELANKRLKPVLNQGLLYR